MSPESRGSAAARRRARSTDTPDVRRTADCPTLLIAQLLRGGYGVRFRAHGGSMHPTIRDGELMTVVPVDPRLVNRGDVLLYQKESGITAHRLVTVAGDARRALYVCRGDSTAADDAPIDAVAVIGRVVAVERAGRTHALRAGRAWAVVRRLRAALRDGVAHCPALARGLARVRVSRRPIGAGSAVGTLAGGTPSS